MDNVVISPQVIKQQRSACTLCLHQIIIKGLVHYSVLDMLLLLLSKKIMVVALYTEEPLYNVVVLKILLLVVREVRMNGNFWLRKFTLQDLTFVF